MIFSHDFTDRRVILFVSDCSLIIRGRLLPGSGPHTMFNLNLYDGIIGFWDNPPGQLPVRLILKYLKIPALFFQLLY